MSAAPLVEALRGQAMVCSAMASPFSAALLNLVAEDVQVGGPAAPLFAPWEGQTREAILGHAAALRWLGAAHDLALGGGSPALQAVWPGPHRPAEPSAAFAVLRQEMAAGPERFSAFMGHEPQTNEVRRSACLLPGFLAIAAATSLPLRTVELGASAGLNLSWDRYGYDYGAAGGWGEAASPVRLGSEWRGPPADLSAPVRVVERRACDRAPVDLADPLAARRLRAYVWADQFERLERLSAAIALAQGAGVRVEAADAADFVAAHAAPAEGAATVVYHSIFWQYPPEATRAAITAALEAHGAAATPAAPLAWLRMEPRLENLMEIELRLTLWPGGEDRRLGRCHPHGAWIAWEG